MPHAAYEEKKKMPPWKPNLVQVIDNVACVYAIRLPTNVFFSLSFSVFSLFVCFNGFAYFLKSYITVTFRHHNCVMLVISEVSNIQ